MSIRKRRQFDLDVLVVGAGIAGLYLLHRLRKSGFTVQVVEAAKGIGGTWYWNRYPGARCDVDSMYYSYQFDEILQQDWEWTERYASQPEILRYLNHVADRYNLRSDIRLNTRVKSAHYNENSNRWRIQTDTGQYMTANYCIMATGCLSAYNTPKIEGLNSFQGPVYHTACWPHDPVEFSGLHVGVIGTGSTGVQVIPEVAKQAAGLTVFQRTPNYVVPARNRSLDPKEVGEIKANYSTLRAEAKATFGGFNFHYNEQSALEATPKELAQEYEKRWLAGGIPFLGAFSDLTFNAKANKTAQDFVRAKIQEIIVDPSVADLLMPNDIIGCKRLCLDSDYFETYNRPNVKLVDVSATPIEAITPQAVRVAGQYHLIDALVLATGFDAMTGALLRIDIQGRDGVTLEKKWEAGPQTYLGLATAEFPNLFLVTGPGSPSVLSNMMPSIEQHVEWISDCLEFMRSRSVKEIEADKKAEDNWMAHVNEVAGKTLRYYCRSWYLGSNMPGKPRVFMPYIGGMPAYIKKCDAVAATNYQGFRLS